MLHEYRDYGNGWPRLCHVSKSKRRDKMGILEFVKLKKTKERIVLSSPN